MIQTLSGTSQYDEIGSRGFVAIYILQESLFINLEEEQF